MEKKLTAQGPKGRQSFTVTLPKEFVMQAGLDKKRSVDLEIVGNKAVISTYKDKAERVLVNGDEYAKNLIKVLQGLYRRGVGELKISYSDSKIVEDIVEIVEQKLIGYEIVEQKKDYLIVKDITKESEEEFKTVFRRIFLLLMELSECEDLVQAKILDRNLKKLINYCQRILMKKGHIDFRKTPLYYLILDRLEKINDEFKWLLKLVIPKKEEVKKEVKVLLRIAYELFYKFETKKYNNYQHRTYLLKNEIRLSEKMSQKTIHMHNLARIINGLYGDIFTLKFGE